MRVLIGVIASLCLGTVCAAQPLESRLTLGGIYVGQVAPDTQVLYEGKSIQVSKDGRFIIGFDRDQPLHQSYITQNKQGERTEVLLSLKQRDFKISRLKVDQKFVTPPESTLKLIAEQSARVKAARDIDTTSADFFKGFDWPVKGRISGVYGSQRYYNGVEGSPHYGLDIAVPTGTPVKAPADGTVRLADSNLYYSGGTIIIDHGHGLTSSFLHLSKVGVKEGDKIKRGEKIGEVGATGRVTGAHLDWRYNWFDRRLDPALLTQQPQ